MKAVCSKTYGIHVYPDLWCYLQRRVIVRLLERCRVILGLLYSANPRLGSLRRYSPIVGRDRGWGWLRGGGGGGHHSCRTRYCTSVQFTYFVRELQYWWISPQMLTRSRYPESCGSVHYVKFWDSSFELAVIIWPKNTIWTSLCWSVVISSQLRAIEQPVGETALLGAAAPAETSRMSANSTPEGRYLWINNNIVSI
jgi:hypothetical protein